MFYIHGSNHFKSVRFNFQLSLIVGSCNPWNAQGKCVIHSIADIAWQAERVSLNHKSWTFPLCLCSWIRYRDYPSPLFPLHFYLTHFPWTVTETVTSDGCREPIALSPSKHRSFAKTQMFPSDSWGVKLSTLSRQTREFAHSLSRAVWSICCKSCSVHFINRTRQLSGPC